MLSLQDKQVSQTHTQLDDVTDNAHDEETDTDGLADLEEFALVGLTVQTHVSETKSLSKRQEVRGIWEVVERKARGRDVRAAVDELSAILDELAGHLHNLLHLARRHGCECVVI